MAFFVSAILAAARVMMESAGNNTRKLLMTSFNKQGFEKYAPISKMDGGSLIWWLDSYVMARVKVSSFV